MKRSTMIHDDADLLDYQRRMLEPSINHVMTGGPWQAVPTKPNPDFEGTKDATVAHLTTLVDDLRNNNTEKHNRIVKLREELDTARAERDRLKATVEHGVNAELVDQQQAMQEDIKRLNSEVVQLLSERTTARQVNDNLRRKLAKVGAALNDA